MLFLSCLNLNGSRKIPNQLTMRPFWIDLELWKNVKGNQNRKTILLKTFTLIMMKISLYSNNSHLCLHHFSKIKKEMWISLSLGMYVLCTYYCAWYHANTMLLRSFSLDFSHDLSCWFISRKIRPHGGSTSTKSEEISGCWVLISNKLERDFHL